MKDRIRRAMQDPDAYVLELCYRDSRGATTRRIVSPIRFLSPCRFLALCLCREEPRQFHLARCSQVSLRPASDVIMPVPMQ